MLLDTGVFVSLLDESAPGHDDAMRWLAASSARLHTVEAVLTETAFFLPHRQRAAVADFVEVGKVVVHHHDSAAYRRIAAILRKYADLGPDWADASLVWLAEQSGIHHIATLDVRDFSTYRIHGRSKFLLETIA
ncbi:MAG TPA: PIN domain-containing protein [Ramlibacter sp.]|nr:PIN domain-containing protein [Ramlibacter sp.]